MLKMEVPFELTWGTKGNYFVKNVENSKKIEKIDFGFRSAYSYESFNCIDYKHKTVKFNVKIGEHGWEDSIGIINNISHKNTYFEQSGCVNNNNQKYLLFQLTLALQK